MDLILTNNYFDVNNIKIKYSKINQKILYKIDEIYLLGIPLKLKNFSLIYQTDKNLTIKLKDTNTINILNKINTFFNGKYQNSFKDIIKEDIIKVRKNNLEKYIDKEDIYISINNIKNRGSINIIHIFVI